MTAAPRCVSSCGSQQQPRCVSIEKTASQVSWLQVLTVNLAERKMTVLQLRSISRSSGSTEESSSPLCTDAESMSTAQGRARSLALFPSASRRVIASPTRFKQINGRVIQSLVSKNLHPELSTNLQHCESFSISGGPRRRVA